MISEEDKTSRTSIEYWFKIMDLTNKGYITPTEMNYFYEEQLSRFEYSDRIPIPFSDILCQLCDMLKPDEGCKFTLKHFLDCPYYASVFFNSLLNLTKLIAYEERDPYIAREDKEKYINYTDWDKFALNEYQRLAVDESDEDDAGAELLLDDSNEDQNQYIN